MAAPFPQKAPEKHKKAIARLLLCFKHLGAYTLAITSVLSHANTSAQNNWLDGLEAHTSDYLSNQATRLDDFFAGANINTNSDANGQANLELKLIPQVDYNSLDDSTTSNLRLRARLQLPNTSQRFKLFIDNDSDTPNGNNTETASGPAVTGRTNVGVGYWLRQNGYNGFIKVGLRSHFAVVGRVGINKQWLSGDNTTTDWQVLGQLSSTGGSSAHSLLSIKHPIVPQLVAEYSPILAWNKTEDGAARLGHTWSMLYALNPRNQMQVGYSTRNLLQHNLTSLTRDHTHWLSYQYTFARPWLSTRLYVANTYGSVQPSHWQVQQQLLIHLGKRR